MPPWPHLTRPEHVSVLVLARAFDSPLVVASHPSATYLRTCKASVAQHSWLGVQVRTETRFPRAGLRKCRNGNSVVARCHTAAG